MRASCDRIEATTGKDQMSRWSFSRRSSSSERIFTWERNWQKLWNWYTNSDMMSKAHWEVMMMMKFSPVEKI